MNKIITQSGIECYWDGANVVVDFEGAGITEKLLLTQREATGLAEQIWTRITEAIGEESYSPSEEDEVDICGILCTEGEALDVVRALDCLEHHLRLRDRVRDREESRNKWTHSDVDWLREGF